MVDEHIQSSVGLVKSLLANNQVPCFFVNGSAELSLLENYTSELVCELKSSLLFFKGIVKCFAVKMPFFTSSEEQNIFINKFLESISIARDCYCEYRGIIIVELDKEWSTHGANEYFACLNQLFNAFNKNCYIVIATEKEKTNKLKSIKSQLSESSVLINAALPDFDLQFYSRLFVSTAADMGYTITDSAKEQINHYLSDIRMVTKDMRQLIVRTLFQIDITKKLSGSDRIIEDLDIASLPGRSERLPKRTKIGFAPNKTQEDGYV